MERIIPAPECPEAEAFSRGLINLLQPRLGAEVVFATDDFFADKARMIAPEPPVFAEEKYDEHGKWMDGWESRRRRSGGHDHAIIRLGAPAVPMRVDIDTTFFTGNFPPSAAIEACRSDEEIPGEDAVWTTLLTAAPLDGDSHNLFELAATGPVTHLKLRLYPDGGVARLRVYGNVAFDWENVGDAETDLAALAHGGRVVAWNNSHYGAPESVLAPGRGVNMGDGWETRRRREPGFDWLIIELGHPGVITRAMVDTAHFKGNFPSACSLNAGFVRAGGDEALVPRAIFWDELMGSRALTADAEHDFGDLRDLGSVSHVRLNIHPDGGISRLRLFGKPARGPSP